MAGIKVGISSCLLGEEVRYNGGHKYSLLCTRELGRHFEFISICPETGIGMGVPRKPIRLVGDARAPRAVGVEDPDLDVTEDLERFAHSQLERLRDACGYIFIKGSPSCGLHRVKVYDEEGRVSGCSGRGVYAREITRHLPLLPVEEAGRLMDSDLRENFVTRVYTCYNWRCLEEAGLSAAAITDFHARYKYVLLAHNPVQYRALGRMLANAGKEDPVSLGNRYFAALMEALGHNATRKTHTNVLMHLQGYLRKHLAPREKQKLGEVIEQYRRGIVPLIVPVTLLKHHFNNHPDDYIARQAYLQPYPDDLSLPDMSLAQVYGL